MAKELWVDASGSEPWERRKKLVTAALECGADLVIVNKDESDKARTLGKIRIGALFKDSEVPTEVNELFDVVITTSGRHLTDWSGFYCEIKSKEDENKIVEIGRHVKYVIIKAKDWKIIPLENIIAGLQKGGKAKIIVEASSVDEARTAFETLEVGVHGVIVSDAGLVRKVKCLIEESSTPLLSLTAVEITKIEPKGMGDRVCVDTASMFSLGEGMLVGSQSNGMFLVHAETLESEYVASRPFRVNAGPVHAYTMLPDGKTTYLSELKAGDEVLAVGPNGKTRVMVVGRCKIEKRPLLLVEAEKDGIVLKTLVQNAETINLVDEKGKAVSVTKLKPGDRVLAYVEEGGRHFGMKVKESIEEK